MASPPPNAVAREVRVAARPETVFSFFVDPVKMVQWKGVAAELDPRPGGTYWVNVTGQNIVRGQFVEVVPYSRIVFTWGFEAGGFPIPPGASTVEVTFVPDGEGTIVRLVHRDLPAEALGPHAEGWEHFLPRLALAASGVGAGPDPWANQPEI